MQERRVVYQVPGMDRVVVRRDLAYKTVEAVDLQFDLYLPPDYDGSTPLPAVVFVHGASYVWAPLEPQRQHVKQWGQYASYGELVAASGLAGVAFNHRSQGAMTDTRAVMEDIDDLLAHIRSNAAALGIDPDRICVWSISLGVPFGVRAALGDGRSFVRCAVAYYGPMDLRPLAGQSPGASFDDLAECSPIAHLDERWPPLLIARAERDQAMGTLINDSIDAFVPPARVAGIAVELLNHPEGEHGFDVANPAERSREIVRLTLEFVKLHLTAPSSG